MATARTLLIKNLLVWVQTKTHKLTGFLCIFRYNAEISSILTLYNNLLAKLFPCELYLAQKFSFRMYRKGLYLQFINPD